MCKFYVELASSSVHFLDTVFLSPLSFTFLSFFAITLLCWCFNNWLIDWLIGFISLPSFQRLQEGKHIHNGRGKKHSKTVKTFYKELHLKASKKTLQLKAFHPVISELLGTVFFMNIFKFLLEFNNDKKRHTSLWRVAN